MRRRVIRWFRLTRLLDAAAAADILTWENSGFSVDASVRITLLARNVPSYFRSLEHLARLQLLLAGRGAGCRDPPLKPSMTAASRHEGCVATRDPRAGQC